MKITGVKSEVYQVPTHREIHDAVRHFDRLGLLLANVETDEGVLGTGFSYTVNLHGALEIASIISRSISELVRGMDPNDHERVWYRMWRSLDWVGRGGIAVLAVAATDIAIWDLKSKTSGMPLYKLLGGYRDKVPVYNTDGGWLNHTQEQLVGEAKAIITAGFRGSKIKVGKDDPLEDVERIAAVRQVLGPNRPLMVDANERFTHAEAIKRAHMWEEFNLYWFEEPLPAECQGRRKTRPEGRRKNRPLPVREGVDLLDRAGVAGAEACASVQAARLGRSGRHPSPIVATCGEG